MSEKTYKVISKAPQLGHKFGETFTAEIPEAQEKRMLTRRAIEVVTAKAPETSEKQTTEKSGLNPGGKRR